jgi:hypothetical protein
MVDDKDMALPAEPDRAVVNGAASVSALRASVPGADDIDDAVDLWHSLPEDGVELHDFLGWSWAEYGEWVMMSRGPNRPLPEAVAQAIETRRAETERLGAQHESAVPEGDAPKGSDHD